MREMTHFYKKIISTSKKKKVKAPMKFFPVLVLLFYASLWSGGTNIQIVQEPLGMFPDDELIIRLQGFTDNFSPKINKSKVQLTIGKNEIDNFSIKPYILSGKPIDILFCVDISGSMNTNPISEVKQAINDFINKLKPPVRIGLCAFGNEFYLLQPFTSNYDSVRMKVKELEAAENRTELYYGIYKAINLFSQFNSPPLRFLILFSDGKNEGSLAYTLDDCSKEAINNKVFVFSIGYTRLNPIYLKNLEKLSDFTDGAYQHPHGRNDIIEAFNKVKNNILSFYIIQYNLKDIPKGLKGPIAIELQVDNKKIRAITEKVISTPGGGAFGAMIVIFFISLSAIGVAIWIYFRRRQDIEAIEHNAKNKEMWYENELRKFRKNIDYIEGLLKNKVNKADEPKDLEKTLILEKNLPPVCVLKNKDDQKNIVIENYPVKIGKSSSCQIKIKNPKISREHAIINIHVGKVVVEDLESTNGVWLNGKKIQKAVLNNGDILSFGPIDYKVELIRY